MVRVLDMGSSLGNMLATRRNYKRDAYVHCQGSLTVTKAKFDISSYIGEGFWARAS